MTKAKTSSRFKRPEAYPKFRHSLLAGLFSIAFIVLVLRLGYIQIVQHQRYLAQAEVQYGLTREIPATRGTIKSSDGFDLAATQPAYLIYANPKQIEQPQLAARQIVDILNQDAKQKEAIQTPADHKPTQAQTRYSYDTVLAQLQQSDKQWVALARKIDQTKVDQITKLQIKGIDFQAEQKRYYPEGTLASQVLGFVAQDNQGNDRGYYGIEDYFNRDLSGRSGKMAFDQDPSGNPIPVGNYQSVPAQDGKTITLTLNRGLQYLLEKKLAEGVERNHAESGSVIVMEPSTGRLLVMANNPTFDPANIASVTDAKVFKNLSITDSYEPGSVIKTFTMATGIEEGVLTPSSTYLSAPYKVGDHTITTANHKYFGPNTTATKMLEASDNTGAAQFAMRIGRDKFIAAIDRVGLNRVTGVTLVGEAAGSIPSAKDWLPITLATASFGQGISVTPLQLLQMMATIANDGLQMKPTIIESVSDSSGTTQVQPEHVGRIFSSQTASTVRHMLADVVVNGEFRRLALQGYGIAGKTSTSQIPIPGGYDPNHTITTFVGFAPADNPKFIMLAKLDKPRTNNSAETVVPLWMDMAKEIFNYYGISPQK